MKLKSPYRERLANLIEAISSGRYQKGRGALKSGDRYCCLGIACDISNLGEWVQGGDQYCTPTNGAIHNAYLPVTVQQYLGFRNQFGAGHRNGLFIQLTDLNDRNTTFDEVLAMLRDPPRDLFVDEAWED